MHAALTRMTCVGEASRVDHGLPCLNALSVLALTSVVVGASEWMAQVYITAKLGNTYGGTEGLLR